MLGINNHGEIVGYFGSGVQHHPNKGYQLFPPYGQPDYFSENFPKSVQTQVTGLNDKGDTVGFYSTQNTASQVNNNFGWYKLNGGSFHEVNFPTGTPAKPPVDQLLGINNHDVAVGFFVNAANQSRGYTYNIATKKFTRVLVPGATGLGPSLSANAINNNGDVAGSYTAKNGLTDAFLDMNHGAFLTLAFPGASATQALGVNDHDEVVGDYMDGTGNSATMHGFIWTPAGGFSSLDDPHGAGTTTINGVNNEGQLVGFYVDADNFTDGFLATPQPLSLEQQLAAMPQGTVTFGRDAEDTVDVTVQVSGLTPGSTHDVELVNGVGGVVTSFTPLTANSAGQADETLESGYKFSVGAWRVVIRNGAASDPVSAEPIAQTAPYNGGSSYALTPVEVASNGTSFGTPQGSASIVYNPADQTISVTVNASGLTPGAHAAHIHIGSCQSQGPVWYMLMDFTANSSGQIVNETRTVTGVTTPLPASGVYLNLHQGDSNNIVSNGQPTINFRPLLCGDI